EGPRAVENGLAADVGVARIALHVRPADLEVVERLVRFEQGAMRVPVGVRHVERRQLPARLADVRRRRYPADAPEQRVRHLGEAEVLVLLPVPVGGELRQAAEPLLALAQRLLGPAALENDAREIENAVDQL